MLGLVVRLGLLLTVVFAVVYALVRARRAHALSKEAERIREEIQALKAGLESGLYSDAEYRTIARDLMDSCEKVGLEVPELPGNIDPVQGRKEAQ